MTAVGPRTIAAIETPIAARFGWLAWSVPAILGLLAILAVGADTTTALRCATAAVAGLVVWIVWQDLRSFTISDAAVLALAVLAVAARLGLARDLGESPTSTILVLAFDGGMPAGLLLAFREIYYRRKGFDGLGLGDVKLAASGGLLVGVVGFSWALFAASVAGLAFVAGLRLLASRAPALTDRLAFGAVLGPAVLVVWLVQQGPLLLARS